MDNKAEKYFSTSPYAYVENNPVYFIDPDGNSGTPFSQFYSHWSTGMAEKNAKTPQQKAELRRARRMAAKFSAGIYLGAATGGLGLSTGAFKYVGAQGTKLAARGLLKAIAAGKIPAKTLNAIATKYPQLYWYLLAIMDETAPTGTGPNMIPTMIQMDVKVGKMTAEEFQKYLEELINQQNQEPEPEPDPKPDPNPIPEPEPEPEPDPKPEPVPDPDDENNK